MPNIVTTPASPSQNGRFFSNPKNPEQKYENIAAAHREIMKPPKNPSHDFFGEIRSNNLCLPMELPTRNAPVSFIHSRKNTDSNASGLLNKYEIATAHAKGTPI